MQTHNTPNAAKEKNRPRLIRLSEVIHLTGMQRTTIYKLINTPRDSGGGFPAPVKLGRASAWPEAEVHAWIAAQVNAR